MIMIIIMRIAGGVEIYRLGQEKEVLNNPSNLSGEDILPNLNELLQSASRSIGVSLVQSHRSCF